MKRLLTILAVLCLVLGCMDVARAAITVTEQPETQTVKAGGSVIFSVKAKDAGKSSPGILSVPTAGKTLPARNCPAGSRGSRFRIRIP